MSGEMDFYFFCVPFLFPPFEFRGTYGTKRIEKERMGSAHDCTSRCAATGSARLVLVLLLLLLSPSAAGRTTAEVSRHGRRPRQLEDPGSYQPDCTTYSFSFPIFRIYDPIWQLVNRTAGGTHGDFWFTAHNMATNVQVECEMKNASLFAPETTYHFCKDNTTRFHMSMQTDDFQLVQSWVCDNSKLAPFSSSSLSCRAAAE